MIITFQSTVPASDFKRRCAAWEKHLRELGFAHPSPPSRLAKKALSLWEVCQANHAIYGDPINLPRKMDGNVNPIIAGLSLAEEFARAPGILARETAL
jgi:hypothetical protein